MKMIINKFKHSNDAKEIIDNYSIPVPESGCWVWLCSYDKNGYGQVHSRKVAKDLGVTRAHQLSYVVYKGTIPKGKVVRHTCDNPECVNPDHLLIGTHQDNVDDMMKRGRYANWQTLPERSKKLAERDEQICKLHGKKSCEEVGELYNMTYSNVCHIWRKNGLTGKNFHNAKHTKR